MILVFQRTGQRRYAVLAKRSPLPDLEMNPAPGYDPLMPHDLLHLIVEAELGLKKGIFGQLAAGGNAGSFRPIIAPNASTRSTSRLRTKVRSRGKRLLLEGRDDAAQSERAAYICWYEWLARSRTKEQRSTANTMVDTAKSARGTAPTKESQTLNGARLTDICKRLDELSAHWSRLEVGQSMSVQWPNLNIAESPVTNA